MSTVARPLPAAVDGVIRLSLKNGLTLLVEPRHQAPVVALQAWVHVGGADEDKSHEAGLAHLHEHMLFKGTLARGVGEVARCVEAAGGEINAWTSFDETVYHLVMGRDAASLGLDLLADVLQHSQFDADELAREIEVVLEEIRRAEDSPGRRHSRALFEAAYTAHPYRHQVLGTAQSVAATTRADMVAFFRGHYVPKNTTLLVVGDVDPQEVFDEVQRLFGAWGPHDAGEDPSQAVAKKMPRAPEPKRTELHAQVLAEPVQDARLTLAWQGLDLKHADTSALDLFAVVLGQGDTSLLHRAMVRPRAVRGAYASNYTPKDPGLFMVGASLEVPRPTAKEVLEVVRKLSCQAWRAALGGFSATDLATARTLVLSDEAFGRQTMEGQANKRGSFVSAAGDYLFERTHTAGIRAAEAQDLQQAATRILDAPAIVVLQLPDDAPADARALGQEDFARAIALGRDEAMAAEKGAKRNHAKAAKSPQNGAKHPRDEAAKALPDRAHAGAAGIVRVQLPQGPIVLLQPEASGVTAMRAICPGGLRWEQPQTGGLALLFGALWGQATQEHSADALAQRVANLGGSLSGFSGRNTVGLSADWLSENHEAGLKLFLSALWRPAFAAEDVLRERHGIAERLRAREDSPGGVAMDLFLSTLYPSHPYGYSALGTAESLARLTERDVAAYHHAHVAADRLVISVVGPIDVDKILETIKASCAAAGSAEPRHPSPTADAPPKSPIKAGRPLAKQQAHVLLGSMGTTFAAADRYPLEVLSAVLSGQSGRLFADLRDAQSLAYSLSCSSAEGLEPGHVFVHMACAFDKVARACEGVRGHLKALRDTPISQGELTRAQQMLIGSQAIDLQRPGARALTYATQELYGLGHAAHLEAAAAIRRVDAAAVQRVARAYLDPERLVEVIVGPGDDAGAA